MNSSKSKEYCKTVASAMPCITGDEKVKVGDEWIRYQEIEINDDDSRTLLAQDLQYFVETFLKFFLRW